MNINKWEKFWGRKDWTPGKEEEESREHLADFLGALNDDAKSGALFKLRALSISRLVMPNGYTVSFAIKQGVKPDERHEWAEPKASNSMTERKIRRCVHCRRAFANRIANERCTKRSAP